MVRKLLWVQRGHTAEISMAGMCRIKRKKGKTMWWPWAVLTGLLDVLAIHF
jgi:hypothetical protein